MANYDLAFPGAAIDAILTTAYDLQNAGYIFKGSASLYSGTPTQRTWLLAPAGFSGYGFSSAIPKGSIGICKYNGSAWSGDLINVVTIDNYPTYNSTNAVTSGGMWQALDDLADGIWDTLQSFVIQDGTTSANQGTQIKFDVKMTDGQQVQHLISSFGILAATTAKAGLMSAADKAKVDAFLDNLRSLSFTDTTSGADVGTKIVETLKMTVGGVQEAITALTILAATTSKAGLMSAADKTYLDGIPSSLSTINTSISKLLAMLGYYECSTAAGTAAKTVSASGYVLTTGGCIRIKMTNANTADNVTLNINSTGAKTLYYDGAQASSSNSWDAGDVLEVYYDGTQYQCASGGGGKFATGENVKDVSIYSDPSQTSSMTDVQKEKMIPNAKAFDEAFAYGEMNVATYDGTGMTDGKILRINGTLANQTGYKTSDLISIPSGAMTIHAYGVMGNNSNVYIGLVLYDSGGNALSAVADSGAAIPSTISLSDYPTAKSFRYCCSTSSSPSVNFTKVGNIKDYFSLIQNEIADVNEEMEYGTKVAATYDGTGMESGKILGVSGSLSNNAGYNTSPVTALPEGVLTIDTSGLAANNANTYIGFLLYDGTQTVLPLVASSGAAIPSTINIAENYPTARYMRYCSATSSSPSVVVNVSGTLKDAVDELQGVKPLAEMVTITSEEHGDKYANGSTYNNQPLWFTQQNCAAEKDGILKTIWFFAPDVGEYEFAVALLDQNSTAVNERFFKLTFTTTGVHEVDVFDMGISIKAGEQVFAHFRSTLKATLLSASSTATSSLFAAAFTNEYNLKWTYGAEAGLAWSIVSIDSPFVLESQMQEMEAKISTLETQAGNIGYVVTQTGDRYRMTVVNGELVLLPTQYAKVLALGNSLTNHPEKTSIGWYGDGWAMAATREVTGWTNQLQRILRQKNNSAVVNSVNIALWEQNPSTNLSSLLDSVLEADVDCIIFRAGENAHPTDADVWAGQIKTLLTYCLTKCPNASLVLSTCMWPNTLKDDAITKVSVEWGLPLVYPGTGSNLERMGDYCEGADDLLHPITDNGVANHVNDVGFLKFANRLASSFGYDELDERHDVNVVDNSNIGYTCFPNWVANGIFSIHTTATTVTATYGSGTAITVTNHNNGVFTFIMPDADVTITLT